MIAALFIPCYAIARDIFTEIILQMIVFVYAFYVRVHSMPQL